ncbi:hypothetical protein DYB32_002697 [Aphanomyces invadans]|uniref:Uncharacterized protein n=1 Tax=Aphanomyces invadans TaxID=157072 RepID=A0A3R6Z7E5_9STRA|nr:hypothetical protein DYB32_002697 [Aphanomyces invadans]
MFKADVHLSDMLHYVHRDEKFFYLTKTTRKYYILGTANHNEHVKAKDYAYMVPHMGKVNMARNGQLPQNVQCPPDVYHTCLEKLAAQDAVAMERAVSAEVEEARCLDTLARELECIHLSDWKMFPHAVESHMSKQDEAIRRKKTVFRFSVSADIDLLKEVVMIAPFEAAYGQTGTRWEEICEHMRVSHGDTLTTASCR